MIIGVFEKGSLSGGSFISERNARFLEILAHNGNRSCEILYTENGLRGLKNRLFIVLFGVNFFIFIQLLKIIFNNRASKFDLWLDRSTMGFLLLVVKLINPNVTTHVYIHNDEYKYHFDKFKYENKKLSMYEKILLLFIKFQQYLSINIACKRYFISAFESGYLSMNKSNFVLPPTWANLNEKETEVSASFLNGEKFALLVGSNFFANISGFKDYLCTVNPKLDITSIFVGKDLLKAGLSSKNIKVYENVISLKPFYDNSHVVVVPISSGAGLKVKLVEALQYGKKVICTEHAASGLDHETLCNFVNKGQLVVANIEDMALEIDKTMKLEISKFEGKYFSDEKFIDFFREYFYA